MLNKLSKRVFLLIALVSSNTAIAEDIYWIPGATLSAGSLELIDATPGFGGIPVADGDFTNLDLSITGVKDNYYLNLKLSTSISGDGAAFGSPGDLTEQEFTLTLGCNCISSIEDLSLFTGLQNIYTDIDDSFNTNRFEDTGFFVGASYPLLRIDAGTLTGTLAYALLDSEITFFGFVTTGETTGLSYSLNWGGVISDNMGYSVAYKNQGYSFKDDSGFGSSLDKTISTIAFGVSYYF